MTPSPLLSIISFIAGSISFVCAILVIVKMFQKSGVGLGIVGIITCGLGAFIWGWIKSKELGITKLMLVWTVAFGVSIVVSGMTMSAIANDPTMQKAMQQGKADMQKAMDEAKKAAEEAKQTPAPVQQ